MNAHFGKYIFFTLRYSEGISGVSRNHSLDSEVSRFHTSGEKIFFSFPVFARTGSNFYEPEWDYDVFSSNVFLQFRMLRSMERTSERMYP